MRAAEHRPITTGAARSHACAIVVALTVTALTITALGGCTGPGGDAGPGDTTPPAGGEPVAEVVRVVGGGGLRVAGAPVGTFLGAGARVAAGKAVTLPQGSVAQLKLGAIGLDLNEDSELTLLAGGKGLALARGELLVRVPRGGGGLRVEAGGDVLHVGAGEARIVRHEDGGSYTSLDGRCRLVSGGRELLLDTGMGAHTPLPEPEPDPEPDTAAASTTPAGTFASVRADEGTDWARILEHVQQQASEIPVGVGSLSAREAGSSFEFQPLKVGEQRVRVSVAGHVAHTRVQQRFDNASSKVLEGIYRFPLPADAAISGLELLIGERWMPAEMVEKKRASQIFQQIVDATVPRDPALLEWDRGSEFKMRIFPIPARGARAVRISYTQVLRAQDGLLRYRYPMAGSGSGASGTTIGAFHFDAQIATEGLSDDAEAQLRVLTLDAERRASAGGIALHAEQTDFMPTRDLGFDLPLADADSELHQEATLAADGKGYFLLSLAPKLPVSPAPGGQTDYAFVLDRSHSTTPELWSLAGTLVQAMVDRMPEGDRYELLACDSACDAMHGGLRETGQEAAGAIKAFVERQDLSGASDVAGAIADAAGRLNVGAFSQRQRIVVYLGDGIASAGPLGAERIVTALGPAMQGVRVEALALGARADLLTLRAIANAAGGDVQPVDLGDDPTQLARTLGLRVRYPAHAGLTLGLPSAAYDVHPRQLPPLRPGQRLVVVGKLRGPLRGEARLSGAGIDQRFALNLHAASPAAGAPERHLARTWAQHEIEARTASEGEAARTEIVELSRTHHVMSRYTSLLALENDAMYREFGVARRQRQSEGWEGELGRPGGTSAAVRSGSGAADADGESPGSERADAKAERPIELAEDGDEGAGVAAPVPAAEPPPSAAQARSAPAPAAPKARVKKGRKAAARPRPSRDASDALSALDGLASGAADDGIGRGGLGQLNGRAGGSGAGAGRARGEAIEARERIVPRPTRPTRPTRRPRPRPVRRVRVQHVRPAGAPGPKTLARLETLRSARDAAPGRRDHHRDLVRTAIVAGHPDAGAYASAWVMADPDHLRALRGLADTLAGAGDPRAMRAYASAAEILPRSKRYQRNLAAAHARRGELGRACAHREALVSIDPADGESHAALVRCLLRAGDRDAARRQLARGRTEAKRARSKLEALSAEVEAGAAPDAASAYLHPSAQLRATLRWDDPKVRLDIGVIDARGRRLSSLFADGLAVREGPGKQTVTLAKRSGTVYLEVTRRDTPDPDRYAQGAPATTGSKPTPLRATLTIEGRGKRSFPVTLEGGSVRVARVATVTRLQR